MLNIVCPKCGTLHHAGEEHIGRLLKCAGCGDAIPVTRVPERFSEATKTVIDTVPNVSAAWNRPQNSRQGVLARRPKIAWLGVAVVFLLLAAVAGIAYHRQQRYAAQLDKQVQDEIAKKRAEKDTPTSPDTLQSDDNGLALIPDKDNQVSPSSPQLDYTPSRIATPEVPTVETSQGTGLVRQPNRDLGIDIAVPVSSSIDLREKPNEESAVILTATGHNLLALIHHAPHDGWYDLIDVHSGEEGWVRQSDVRINRTEYPQPAAKFSEEYVGTNSAPEVTVANQTSGMLTLKIGDSSPQRLQPGEHQIPIPEGTLDFYATVPDAIPTQGRETFRRGYRYKWSFWIEMHSTRIP